LELGLRPVSALRQFLTLPAFISDAKRHHAAIRLVVSTMSGGRPTKFARLLGHLGLPRLHVSAEPVGTVRWGHASAPLSVAPLPVPTGIRDPASSSQEASLPCNSVIRFALSRRYLRRPGSRRTCVLKASYPGTSAASQIRRFARRHHEPLSANRTPDMPIARLADRSGSRPRFVPPVRDASDPESSRATEQPTNETAGPRKQPGCPTCRFPRNTPTSILW
jgi:hypothetical protein